MLCVMMAYAASGAALDLPLYGEHSQVHTTIAHQPPYPCLPNSNVPGVALYFYSVSELRRLFSTSAIPYLSQPTRTYSATSSGQASTMAKLTPAGNIVTGAVARTVIGFILCPVTVVKARFEVSRSDVAV